MATLTTHNHQLQHHQPSTNDQAPHRIEMMMAGTAAEARDTTHLFVEGHRDAWHVRVPLSIFSTHMTQRIQNL